MTAFRYFGRAATAAKTADNNRSEDIASARPRVAAEEEAESSVEEAASAGLNRDSADVVSRIRSSGKGESCFDPRWSRPTYFFVIALQLDFGMPGECCHGCTDKFQTSRLFQKFL